VEYFESVGQGTARVVDEQTTSIKTNEKNEAMFQRQGEIKECGGK
jgi:hypothetical protein